MKCFNWHSQVEYKGYITVFSQHAKINSLKAGLHLPCMSIFPAPNIHETLNIYEMKLGEVKYAYNPSI